MVTENQEEAVRGLFNEDALRDLHENDFTGKLVIEWKGGKVERFDLNSRISLGKNDFPMEGFKE